MSTPDPPHRADHRGDARAGRRDRRHDPRPRGERLAPGGRWRPIAASRSRRSTSDPTTSRSTSRTSSRSSGRGRSSSRSGYASNAVGTINPVREIVARAHEVGALTYVDAVAYAPHGPIDVRALDTDFLACSAYKWFGPHLGALYGKAEVLDRLPAFKVRPAHDRFETGTPVVRIDRGHARGDRLPARRRAQLRRRDRRAGRRRRAASGGASSSRRWSRSPTTSGSSSTRLIDGLERIAGVTIHGITDPARFAARVPTVSVSIAGVHAAQRPPRRSAGTGSTPGTATSTRPASSSGSARPRAAASCGSGSSTTTRPPRSTARSTALERIAGRPEAR